MAKAKPSPNLCADTKVGAAQHLSRGRYEKKYLATFGNQVNDLATARLIVTAYEFTFDRAFFTMGGGLFVRPPPSLLRHADTCADAKRFFKPTQVRAFMSSWRALGIKQAIPSASDRNPGASKKSATKDEGGASQ
ncbi:hypothetical protein DK37_16885 [Halomonas sp. SUBG004]|nr:hypothetical protein DK37_16885 [Halomonas sp. SUBG004]